MTLLNALVLFFTTHLVIAKGSRSFKYRLTTVNRMSSVLSIQGDELGDTF